MLTEALAASRFSVGTDKVVGLGQNGDAATRSRDFRDLPVDQAVHCGRKGKGPLPLAPLHFAAEDLEEPYPLRLDNLHAVIGSASANTIELLEGDAHLAVDR